MKVVLGTMTFGVGSGGRVSDRAEIRKFLDIFKSFGFDELDTARMYCGGNTEEVLAELNLNTEFKIATKAYPKQPGDHQADKLKRQFNKSLAALKASKVDIFYLHAPDHDTPYEETLKAVNEMYKAGHFSELGLSNYSSWEVMEIYKICQANRYVLPTVYQGMYSVFVREAEAELFPCLRKLGIRFYAFNPILGGLLSGKQAIDKVPDEGRFSNTAQGKIYRDRYWNTTYFTAIEKYKKACADRNLNTVDVTSLPCAPLFLEFF